VRRSEWSVGRKGDTNTNTRGKDNSKEQKQHGAGKGSPKCIGERLKSEMGLPCRNCKMKKGEGRKGEHRKGSAVEKGITFDRLIEERQYSKNNQGRGITNNIMILGQSPRRKEIAQGRKGHLFFQLKKKPNGPAIKSIPTGEKERRKRVSVREEKTVSMHLSELRSGTRPGHGVT